jgi:hypothetical protein
MAVGAGLAAGLVGLAAGGSGVAETADATACQLAASCWAHPIVAKTPASEMAIVDTFMPRIPAW